MGRALTCSVSSRAAAATWSSAFSTARRARSDGLPPLSPARAASAAAEAAAAPAAGPSAAVLQILRASSRVARSPPKAAAGPSRGGPTRTVRPPPSTLRRESPPTPMETVAKARTRVRRPCRSMPSRSTTGEPSTNRARSVVVPPMSSKREQPASTPGQRASTPITLAAGPERMDCTGSRRERATGTAPPSALSRRTAAVMPASARAPSTASRKSVCRRCTAAL